MSTPFLSTGSILAFVKVSFRRGAGEVRLVKLDKLRKAMENSVRALICVLRFAGGPLTSQMIPLHFLARSVKILSTRDSIDVVAFSAKLYLSLRPHQRGGPRS